MTLVRCPTCHREFDQERSAALPFCGNRCRQIDMGRWLDEKYGLPWEPEDDADRPARETQTDERHEESAL